MRTTRTYLKQACTALRRDVSKESIENYVYIRNTRTYFKRACKAIRCDMSIINIFVA